MARCRAGRVSDHVKAACHAKMAEGGSGTRVPLTLDAAVASRLSSGSTIIWHPRIVI